ncbi:unnamed protein product [Soboliphyme baturini]|uniref:ADAM10 endopeptidase n=1 Tax=Soboliphyme baturini TaxID=241478 RepID=A0A183IXL4_9BILA|nr:unnamed protein product [Soboliphyme baturini]
MVVGTSCSCCHFSLFLVSWLIFTCSAKRSPGSNLKLKWPTPFLSGFEEVHYDRSLVVQQSHERRRRSLSSLFEYRPLELSLKYGERVLQLELKRDTSVFGRSHVLEENGRTVASPDVSHLYSGHVLGEPNSVVHGSVIDGVFDGDIYLNGDVFHVERISKFGSNVVQPSIHSIVYKEEDIQFANVRLKRSPMRSNATVGCGLQNDAICEWMQRIRHSAVDDGLPWTLDETTEQKVKFWPSHLVKEQKEEAPSLKYLAYRREDNLRTKRDAATETNGQKMRTCSLYLQADQKLWEHVFLHEGQRNYERTRNEILALFHSHIKAVNVIFEDTDFNGIKGINFVVQRTTIFNNRSCPGGSDGGNPFCEENMDISNFLNLHSRSDHSDFCLSYVFTYRDFTGGTLGLAWVASPQVSASGGICEPFKHYLEGTRRVKRSLNTGVVTLVNYHNRVLPRISQLTLAHELGHSFGSLHDYPSQCQPGLPDGNFLMFASATAGDRVNNARFSPCSVNNISAVLREMFRQAGESVRLSTRKRNCFILRETSFCGNAMVEDGEECDCGFNDDECRQRGDSCCYPRSHVGEAKGCTRTPWAECSPSEGVCCDGTTCKYVPADSRTCRQASECSHSQMCDGHQSVCPPSKPRPGGTLCQENSKICDAFGACSQSICSLLDMDECFVTDGTPTEQCVLACRRQNASNGPCIPSYSLPQLRPFYHTSSADSATSRPNGILLRPGSPCNDFRGYCDVLRRCRSIDPNGPLSRLRRLLFESENIQTLLGWVQTHWWSVVLLAIGLLVTVAMFVKCCAVHTPSTNPYKSPARSVYDTLRYPSTLLSRGHRRRDCHVVYYAPSSPSLPTNNNISDPPPPYCAAVPELVILRGYRGHRR